MDVRHRSQKRKKVRGPVVPQVCYQFQVLLCTAMYPCTAIAYIPGQTFCVVINISILHQYYYDKLRYIYILLFLFLFLSHIYHVTIIPRWPKIETFVCYCLHTCHSHMAFFLIFIPSSYVLHLTSTHVCTSTNPKTTKAKLVINEQEE